MRKILLMAAVAVMAVACGGKGGGKADGPEAVVAAFSKAVAAGQWEEKNPCHSKWEPQSS